MAKAAIYIVMNRHKITANRRRPAEEREPTVRVTRGKRGRPLYCDRVEIDGPSELLNGVGEPVMPCGATIAIKTRAPVRLITRAAPDIIL